jgi:Flp pilus assembly pilin Flp
MNKHLGHPSGATTHGEWSEMLTNLALRALTAIKSLESKLKDDEGQTLAEYGLIMAVIAVAVVVAAGVTFRGAIIGAFSTSTDCLNKASSSGGC